MAGLYGNGIALTEKTLNYLWARQNLTLNNIANVDTPGYKSQYLTFEAELAERISDARKQQRPMWAVGKAIDNTKTVVHTTTGESSRLDENNVDMDQEQVDLVRTTYEYQIMSNSITNELNRLRSAAKSF